MEWLWGTLGRAVTPYPSVCQPGRPAVADRQPLRHQQRPTTVRNSAMQHEFPGSILVYGPGSARMAWLAVRSRPCPLAIGLTLGCGRDGRGGRRVEQGQELALSVIALCQATGSSNRTAHSVARRSPCLTTEKLRSDASALAVAHTVTDMGMCADGRSSAAGRGQDADPPGQ